MSSFSEITFGFFDVKRRGGGGEGRVVGDVKQRLRDWDKNICTSQKEILQVTEWSTFVRFQ